jgi:hypothetical protein
MGRLRQEAVWRTGGVLAYLSGYTHRVAISNRRLIAADTNAVTFKYKDYRVEGAARFKTMTLATAEFIRRFLIHALPKGFHRIRDYGLLANGNRANAVAKARELFGVPAPFEPGPENIGVNEQSICARPCPCCGGRMLIIEVFARGSAPRYQPVIIRLDTSRRGFGTAQLPIDAAGSPPASLPRATWRIINRQGRLKQRAKTISYGVAAAAALSSAP